MKWPEVGRWGRSICAVLSPPPWAKSRCWFGETPPVMVAGEDVWDPVGGKNRGNETVQEAQKHNHRGEKMKKPELLSLK